MSRIQRARFRNRESTFSLVATIISFLPSVSSLRSKSPVAIPTLTFLSANSSNFSLASAFSGTI